MTPQSHRGGRTITTTTVGDLEVHMVKQKNGKIDAMIIDCGDLAVITDSAIAELENVIALDPYNCYPYQIVATPMLTTSIQAVFDANGIGRSTEYLPFHMFTTHKEWCINHLVTMSATKGASKGANGAKSVHLDAHLLKWVSQGLPTGFTAMHPTRTKQDAKKSDLEDLRIIRTSDQHVMFRQENKSISEVLNITERLHMVYGKGVGTGGDIYNLFVSFVGHTTEFLPFVQKQATSHIAHAYIEFTKQEQTALMKGDYSVCDTKHVWLPVSSTPADGVVQGPLLRDYYHQHCV